MQIHRRKHAHGYRVILHKLWQGLPFRVAALKIFHALWNERKIESVHKWGECESERTEAQCQNVDCLAQILSGRLSG